MKTSHSLLLAGFCLTLAACGGGGSGTSPVVTQPEVKKCTNGGTDYPTCTPPYEPADLQLTVAVPPFAEGSDDLRAFNYVNDLRASLGLGKLSYNAELTKAANAHATYLFVNNGYDHDENPALPSFYGATPGDRAKKAGYTSDYVGEGIAIGNSYFGAFERLLGSVYHRSTLLNQSMRDFGFSGYQKQSSTIMVFNPGYKTPQRNASDFVMTYPKDKQTGVNLSMCGEIPWPFPEISVDQACTNPRYENGVFVADMKVGYPVSIAIQEKKELTVTKFEMFEAGSNTPIPVWLTTKADKVAPIPKNEAYITAKAGLKPLTKYEVNFTGLSDGIAFTKSWSFTTASYLYSN